MRFVLLDRVVELIRGERIVAVKAVTLAEEYLGDHFPAFPVLPGVLMMQTLVEAGSWLVMDALDFPEQSILLREARNVTYKEFVRPGSVLRAEVDCRRLSPEDSEFSGAGYCGDDEVVKARFSLKHLVRMPVPGADGGTWGRMARARWAILRAQG